ncbi:uncharacterized [Tachysurus ichikawai]
MTGADETTDRAVKEACVATDMEGCEVADLCKQPHKPASGVYVSHDLLRARSLTASTKQEPLYLQRTGAEHLLGSIAYKLGQFLGLISSWSRLPSLEFAGSANSGSCLCVQMAGKAEHGERRELLNGGKSALHLSMARK